MSPPRPQTVVFDAQATTPPDASTTAFERYYRSLSWPGTLGQGAAFLGTLRADGGPPRLAVVEVYPLPSGLRLGPAVFSIGSAWNPPAEAAAYSPSLGFGGRPPGRVYAGQTDPADPSHFTIRVDDAVGERVVDGWLQANDSIDLELRP